MATFPSSYDRLSKRVRDRFESRVLNVPRWVKDAWRVNTDIAMAALHPNCLLRRNGMFLIKEELVYVDC